MTAKTAKKPVAKKISAKRTKFKSHYHSVDENGVYKKIGRKWL